MLEVSKLSKEFQSGDKKFKAVDEIDLKVEDKTFVAIVGKSGSGKSTLLSLLGALERPTKGSITVDGIDIARLPDRKLVKYRRKEIGFIFQHYNLIPNLTALENVMLPMEYAGVTSNKRKERAIQLLNEVGLSEVKQQRLPSKLSGGEQQRVSIARALANKPKIILADEPTGNLDSHTSKLIVELLKRLVNVEDTTIIVVTHDLNITSHTDQTFQLKDGKLVHRGSKISDLLS